MDYAHSSCRLAPPALVLAAVWISLSGCVMALAIPQDNGSLNRFESCSRGPFRELTTPSGTWSVVTGSAKIDGGHASSGEQCLQIAGEDAVVELTLNDEIQTGGNLRFRAERWTARSPFSFRIEKQSRGEWSEIYNGDSTIRVGRGFLSEVKLRLDDPEITRLRFSVSSPAETGILIDDFRFEDAKPMEIVSVEKVHVTLPALIGTGPSAIARLKITVRGELDPISVTGIQASPGENMRQQIAMLQPFYCANDSRFRADVPVSDAQSLNAGAMHLFPSSQTLVEGDNFFWLACQLHATADMDGKVAAKFDSISFSNEQTKTFGESDTLDGGLSVQRSGVAVRKAGDDGVHTCRIPGLVTTNKGTLIGVYDIRHEGSRDLPGNIDVGMSRSTDGGRTWEPMRVIMDMGDDPRWNGDGIGDPSILVDRETGTILVSAIWSHGDRSWTGSGPGLLPEETGQWMIVRSKDDGITWSEPVNITNQIKKPEWSFLLQGPGKGITMSDGTIVFPAQYQDPPDETNPAKHRLPHSTIIFSRDHGATWNVGTAAADDTTEAQVVELADGELMLNCRYNREPKRLIVTSRDFGETWQTHPTSVNDLIEPRACMANLINVGRELSWRGLDGFDNQLLLFSNPDSSTERSHLTIKASRDSGSTWPGESQLLLDEQSGRGYSCMTMIDAETVGILYEGSQADLVFQRIRIAEILKGSGN